MFGLGAEAIQRPALETHRQVWFGGEHALGDITGAPAQLKERVFLSQVFEVAR